MAKTTKAQKSAGKSLKNESTQKERDAKLISDKKALEERKAATSEKLKASVADLSTFKTEDVTKWTKKKNSSRRTSSAANTGFGGSRLGAGTRLQRKKNNKSQR